MRSLSGGASFSERFPHPKTTIENLLKTLLKQARQKEARMFARPGLFAA